MNHRDIYLAPAFAYRASAPLRVHRAVHKHRAPQARPPTAGVRRRPEQLNVSVFADDNLSAFGVLACLNAVPGVTVLPAGRSSAADVVLLLVAALTDESVDRIRAVRAAAAVPQCIVVITEDPDPRIAVAAVTAGVVSILSRSQTTAATLVDAVMSSAAGDAVLPAHVTRRLIERSQSFERIVLEGYGIAAGGLTVREIEVLRMLADGQSTRAIAERLNYAERTIKNIIQEILSRTGLHNRTQAVAYAIRVGAV